MFAKKQTIIHCALLPILLMTCATAFALSYGDGYFYVGGMLNLYNPREAFYLGEYYYYDYFEVATGMGPGLNMGLNLTSHLSFPDISADMIIHNLKYPYRGYMEHFDAQMELRIYNIMFGVKYKFGYWRVEPYVRGGILFQDIRLKESIDYVDSDEYNYTETSFYWGFAPYIGGGISYYITPRIYMSVETLYSNGTGSYKSVYEEYHTIRIGGNHINFTMGFMPF